MGSRWVGGEFAFVTEAKAKSLEANLARPRDLVFTQRGTLGQVALVPPRPFEVYLISQSQMKLTVDAKKADALFLYYVFTSQEQLEYIRQHAIQTGVPHTNLGILRETPIPLPRVEEQHAIALTLGELDNKIELNRQMSKTLENMVWVLFKSWFVDFDPVHAQAEGRDSGLSKNVVRLFPNSFNENEGRQFPQGWRIATVAELCQSIFSGGTPSTQVSSFWGGEIPWLSSGETRNRFITKTDKTITSEGVANSSTRMAKAGCTVIASAGQGNTRGQASLLMFDSYINQSVVALAANPDLASELYLFFNLSRRYDEFRQVSDSHSSRGSLTTKLLASLPIIVPPRELVAEFDAFTRPIVERIRSSVEESDLLASLRNSLLPKLVSGELRLRDLERIVGAKT